MASEEARRWAAADARHWAEIIADAAGGRLRPLRGISEGSPAGPAPYPGARMMAMAADAAPTPVMPGQVEVSVTVTAEWELLPVGLV
jgi:uncharacterized protein YggE